MQAAHRLRRWSRYWRIAISPPQCFKYETRAFGPPGHLLGITAMRLSFSALLLSTALATGLGAGALTVFTPVVHAQAVTAGEVDVDALLKLIPPTAKATYGSKSYDALTGITTVRDLKIADAANEAQNFIAVQELGLRGLDLAAFQYVFDFAKYGATLDETFKQLFGDVMVKNASVTMAGVNVASVEEISFGGVQMKQLAAKPPGEFGTADDEKARSQFLGAMLDSLITGEIKMTNFTAEGEGNKASVKGLVFGGINRGQFGASTLDTFESVAEGITTKIASAKSDGADFSKGIQWLLKAELPPISPDALLYFGAASVNGISYDKDGTVFTIGSYTIDPINFYWLVPTSLKIGINDIYYKPSAADASGGQEALTELGLDHIDMDLSTEWTFDVAGGNASLKEWRIAVADMFEAKLSFDLTGINLAQLIDPATTQSALFGVGISGAQFFFKNDGGFDKILAAAAKEENTTPDALKQQALDQLTQIESGMPQPDGTVKPLTDRLKSIVAAFKSFIQSPGTLSIKVQPAAPITAATGMGAMFDPMAAADTLGVTVEATPQ